MKSPFNSYDERGFRITETGSCVSRVADEALLYNLRFRWKEELKQFSDATLINEYDNFALSDMWGDNDARFLEWMSAVES